MRTTLAAAAIAGLVATAFGWPALAQMKMDHGSGHSGMTMSEGASEGGAEASASTQAFVDAADKMHRDMSIDYTGNADVDFARGMIPHHEAAVEMARIELEHGTDPTLRRMAEAVIAAQEAEIAELKAWLEANGQ